MASPARSGFTLIDLVAVVFVLSVLAAILVFLVERARIKAMATGCRENLRRIGMAMADYTTAQRTLPVVELAGRSADLRLAHSPQALLSVYLTESGAAAYDPRHPWFEQRSSVGAGAVPVFRCPATSQRDPLESIQAEQTNCPLGSRLGTTDYLVCKGPNDSWCIQAGVSSVPLKERGAFEIGRPLRPADIVDGLSETMVVGEGAGDGDWQVAALHRFPIRAIDERTGKPLGAFNFWCWPFFNTFVQQQTTHAVGTSIFGTTAIVMNKPPVVETIVDNRKLDDCRPRSKGGVHAVSGFRSDHAEGCFFLFADGSSHFVSEGIEPRTYQALSTIAGGESVRYIE